MMLRLGITRVVIISCSFNILGLSSIILFLKSGTCFSVWVFVWGCIRNIRTRFKCNCCNTMVYTKTWLSSGSSCCCVCCEGQLTLLPVMAWITTIYDWRMAVVPCLVANGICAVGFLLFAKNWPSELKIPPFGDSKIFMPPSPPRRSAVFISFSALFQASQHPGFWMLACSFFICGLTSSGLVGQHFIPFCADNDIGIVAASSYLALMGIFNFLGTTASGWLSDRYDNYGLLATYYGLRGVSLIFLPYSNFDVYALSLWAIFLVWTILQLFHQPCALQVNFLVQLTVLLFLGGFFPPISLDQHSQLTALG